MKKIGFIDYFLNEWHANNYPAKFQKINEKLGGEELKVCYAYAELDASPDGQTTDEWCKQKGIERCYSIQELVDKSDYIIVMSPDNPERHEHLCEIPLKSGKPVYVDKTFATDKATAERIFQMAKEGNTPTYSSSALRFANELAEYRKEQKPIENLIAIGPGEDNYQIHTLEIIRTVIHQKPMKVKCTINDDVTVAQFAYADGKTCDYVQVHKSTTDFQIIETNNWSTRQQIVKSDYFSNCMLEMVEFFKTGKVAVEPEETVEIISMLESLDKAKANPNQWIEVK